MPSKIIGDDEDELESDDLYSDEDLTLNSLGNLRCSGVVILVMFEKGIMIWK